MDQKGRVNLFASNLRVSVEMTSSEEEQAYPCQCLLLTWKDGELLYMRLQSYCKQFNKCGVPAKAN